MSARICVIGGGVAGMGAAWRASPRHEVVLMEADSRLGGHVHTHDVRLGDRDFRVDTGFIVFNRAHYPLLSGLFDALGVATQPTTMGFSVQEAATGLEYSATSLDQLFVQRRNLVSPRFWGMLRDLRRFYREAPALLASSGDGPGLGEYLQREGYGEAFIDAHLVPMASALWSSPAAGILEFPAKYLVRFMDQHRMLQVDGRPEWRVVTGGSHAYVDALQSRWPVQVRTGTPVQRVRRRADGRVDVVTAGGTDVFDAVVLACHGDDALRLLDAPSDAERQVLGAITYQDNDTVLHTDARMLPARRRAWAAWNAHVPAERDAPCTVSYCMNLLQRLDAPEPLVVTLNRTGDVDPGRILARMRYRHPVYTRASVAAQARIAEISGADRIWYAGAWCGFGFHEDGLRSGYAAADGIIARQMDRRAA